jgi:hypothetical protein
MNNNNNNNNIPDLKYMKTLFKRNRCVFTQILDQIHNLFSVIFIYI